MLLGTDCFSNKIREQNKIAATGKESTKPKAVANAKKEGDRASLVSWLFLLGSLIFSFDSLLEVIEAISLHSIFHISASLLFTVGSVLFMPSKQD